MDLCAYIYGAMRVLVECLNVHWFQRMEDCASPITPTVTAVRLQGDGPTHMRFAVWVSASCVRTHRRRVARASNRARPQLDLLASARPGTSWAASPARALGLLRSTTTAALAAVQGHTSAGTCFRRTTGGAAIVQLATAPNR